MAQIGAASSMWDIGRHAEAFGNVAQAGA